MQQSKRLLFSWERNKMTDSPRHFYFAVFSSAVRFDWAVLTSACKHFQKWMHCPRNTFAQNIRSRTFATKSQLLNFVESQKVKVKT